MAEQTDQAGSQDSPAPEVAASEPIESGKGSFPIVGLGASAGGLAAFEAFFSGLPADRLPGMAFVLVQHLAPDHKSLLVNLLARCTTLPVAEATDGVLVEPDRVYIIPPARDLALLNGRLQVLEPSQARGHRLPIDFFFRSLAQDQRERAIAVVLSGTGSDGTLGVRDIKGMGGLVLVQNPESAEFDSMPRSAIATGSVDVSLPPEQMVAKLLAFATGTFAAEPMRPSDALPASEGALQKVFVLLRSRTGHDFSQYKPSTVLRRVARRMALHQIGEIGAYLSYLRQEPGEVDALFGDLLIGVTRFFRDTEAFSALELQVIPAVLAQLPDGDLLRVWVVGCSTGEEAYSIAMLLHEQLQGHQMAAGVQIFATDIDRRAIAVARAGRYPASITDDVSPQRLARYFSIEPGESDYRVRKSIRDMILFSEHSLIKDPPFSHMHLVSCRNLLIYLNSHLQKKLIPLLHYALKPGGFLLLGNSESVGDFNELFSPLDHKVKCYQRLESLLGAPRAALNQLLAPTASDIAARIKLPYESPALVPRASKRLPLRELTEQAMLAQLGPAGALVNGQGDILYLHGRVALYLEPVAGEAGINNILKMARQGLRHALSSALRQTVATQKPVHSIGLEVKTQDRSFRVNLSISPLTVVPGASPDAALYLVVLETVGDAILGQGLDAVTGADGPPSPEGLLSEPSAEVLEQALRRCEDQLQRTRRELESSFEDLKSSNEEMQSVNEELQSSNEELESSKEELQSVNEELNTVNTELQTKVADLSHINDDMNNLLAGSDVATLFVDMDLRILRFTPRARAVVNLIAADIGRPVAHIATNLVGYGGLLADLTAMLATLAAKEQEVQTVDGRNYLMRMLPYRTLANTIEGAVINFVDITELKRARQALGEASALRRLAVVVRDASDAITVQGLDGATLAWNPAASRLYGWSEDEALRMNVRERVPPAQREQAMVELQALGRAEIPAPHRSPRLCKSGALLDIWLTATPLLDDAGRTYAIATTERPFQPVQPNQDGSS